MFPAQWWIILLVALVLNSVGFKKYVWFMTIGYGLSVGGISLCLSVMAIVKGQFSGWYLTLCLLLMLYGFRLVIAFLLRDKRNTPSNKKLMDNFEKNVSPTGLIFMWLFDSVVYYAIMSPVFYRLANEHTKNNGASMYIGIFIVAAGIVIEVVAEFQKFFQKRENPNLPAMKGLYRISRCPDYFGEILVWTGVCVTGIKTTAGFQWLVVLFGYAYIIHMMLNGAKRIEMQHIRFYGRNKSYVDYANKTPVLFPFVPVFHLVKTEPVKKQSKQPKILKKSEQMN
ncbi:MAG: DUF1295 domain-containing protein [Lachnospiraceae bacterium]|nr:DUF1295 domain-containing protein [Lachnospiraceae bacterium]